MPVYDTPYYGTRRKALTGMGYGPYYGISLTGGGALPAEGRRALPTGGGVLPAEILDKYQATGTPAITETAEGIASPALEGSMATTPGASWGQLGYSLGLPVGSPPPGTPRMKGGIIADVAKGAAKWGVSKLTGLSVPFIAWNQFTRNFLDPLLAAAFPSLFTQPQLGGIPSFSFNMATNQFDVDRSIAPLSETATFTGLPDTSDIFGVFSEESMSTPTGQAAALAATGSTAALGSPQAFQEASLLGFGQGFGGGTSTGFGQGEGADQGY